METQRVNVIDDSGEVQSLPQSQLSEALRQGYRVASPEETTKHFEKQEYSGILPALAAGAAGAARGISFGLSDVGLTKSGLVNPETLKNLEEYQPAVSTSSELGAITASLLWGQGEATLAAKAASAPVRAAAKAGQVVSRGVEAVLPEATTLAGKLGTAALSHGAAGAAEGALYGAGRVATEYAFGDPDLNAEKILSHVGMGAMVGGTIGGALGLTGKAATESIAGLQKYMQRAPLPVEGPAIIKTPAGPKAVMTAPEGTLERSMQEAGFPLEKIEEVTKSSSHLKPNYKKIISDSQTAGLQPMEGQISSNKHVQRTQSMLFDKPGRAGEQQRAIFDSNWSKAGGNFEEALSTGETRSAQEAGVAAKDLIKEQIDAIYQPIKEGYESLGPTRQHIPIADEPRLRIVSDLIEEAENSSKGSIGGPRQKQFMQWAERIAGNKEYGPQTTLGHFTSLESELGKAERAAWRSGLYDDAEAMSDIKSKLRDFNNEQIAEAHRNFAIESGMPLEEANKMANSFKARTARLNKEYAKFVETLGELSGSVKLGKVRTYREVMEALEKIEPSKLAENAFKGDRINALNKLQKEFPAAFDLFVNQNKKEILESLTKDGAVNPRKAYKELDKIPKEIKNMLFSPEQIEKMRATKTWVEALPEDWAPSKTPRGMMMMEYYNNPVKALTHEATGLLQEQFIKHSVQELHSFGRVKTATDKITSKILSGAKAIFKTGKELESVARGWAASKAADLTISHEKQMKMVDQINELNSNPSKFIDHMEASTRELYDSMPGTAQAVHATAIRAVQYLSRYAPVTKSPYPLGEDFMPSKSDMNIFAERIHVLDNPTMVMNELKQGTAVPAHVEAVATVYPKLYQEMQQAVMGELTNAIAKKQMIPYKTKNMLSMFLGQDLDSSITPQAVMANQQIIAQSQLNNPNQDQMMTGQMGKTTQKGLDKLMLSNNMKTSMQQSSQRNMKA